MSRTTTVHSWGAATRTTPGAATGIRVGAYHEGQLFIHVLSMSGTNPRLRPRWESAPGDEPKLPKQPCTRCGAEALCLDCCETAWAASPGPSTDPLSPEERARYDVLIQHQHPRHGRHDAL